VTYVDANGVHTYYEEHGSVNQLVLDFLAAEGPATTMMPLRRK